METGAKAANIVWHQTSIQKEDRHRLNKHKSAVLWFTGLSGAGKSTLAIEIEKELFHRGLRSYVLDGDNIRHGLNQNLGFTPDDRKENIRRIGEVSKLFVEAGLFTLTAFISPYCADRDVVRAMFQPVEFIEIYVKCAIEECERRDPKGLYKKARAGEIKDFTGVSAPYEAPLNPELVIANDRQSIEESVDQVIRYLEENNYLK